MERHTTIELKEIGWRGNVLVADSRSREGQYMIRSREGQYMIEWDAVGNGTLTVEENQGRWDSAYGEEGNTLST